MLNKVWHLYESSLLPLFLYISTFSPLLLLKPGISSLIVCTNQLPFSFIKSLINLLILVLSFLMFFSKDLLPYIRVSLS